MLKNFHGCFVTCLAASEVNVLWELWHVHMNAGLSIWFPVSLFGLLLKVPLSRCPMKTLACTNQCWSFQLVSCLCVCIAIESPIIQILWAILFALTYFVGEEWGPSNSQCWLVYALRVQPVYGHHEQGPHLVASVSKSGTTISDSFIRSFIQFFLSPLLTMHSKHIGLHPYWIPCNKLFKGSFDFPTLHWIPSKVGEEWGYELEMWIWPSLF